MEKVRLEILCLTLMVAPTAKHSEPDVNNWLHNDMKDVGYYFNYKLYDRIVKEGDLR